MSVELSAFLAAWSGPPATGELAAVLARMLAEAHAAWPAAPVPGERFAAYLAERCDRERAPEVGLAELDGSDLYLCGGCVDRVAAAQEALAGLLAAHVPRFVASLQLPHDVAHGLPQGLYERLLVPAPGGGPPLAGYGGRGPLLGW